MSGTTLHADVAAKELRRWLLALGIPMIAACAFTAAALGGLGAWLLAPAIVVGPGIGGIALIWLALSTDTNGAPASCTRARSLRPSRRPNSDRSGRGGSAPRPPVSPTA